MKGSIKEDNSCAYYICDDDGTVIQQLQCGCQTSKFVNLEYN